MTQFPRSNNALGARFLCNLQKARVGDGIALGQLLQASLPYLRTIIVARLRDESLPFDHRHDLMQETLLHAWTGFASFQGDSEQAFRGWLRSICIHLLADLRREEQHVPKSPLPPKTVLIDDKTPSWWAMQGEEAQAYRKIMAQLEDEEREIILLRRQARATWEVVGRHFGCSAEAARKMHMRAMRKLGRVLQSTKASLGNTSSGTQLAPTSK